MAKRKRAQGKTSDAKPAKDKSCPDGEATPPKRAKARSEPTQKAEPRIPGRLEGEVIALVLLVGAAFLEVALYTYAPGDPLWGLGSGVANRCGPVGAAVAGGLMRAIGLAGHALPVAGVVLALRYLRSSPPRARALPLMAWIVFVLSLAASLDNLRPLSSGWIPPEAGGVAGATLAQGLVAAFYPAGTQILLTLGLTLSFLLATGLSVRDSAGGLLRGVGSGLRRVGQAAVVARARVAHRREERTARREQRQDEKRERRAAKEVASERQAAKKAAAPKPRGEPEVVQHVRGDALTARQKPLPLGDSTNPGPFRLPEPELLAQGADSGNRFDREELIQNSQILEKKLDDFGVKGRCVKVHPGPVITMYEFEPAPGIKVSRITNLADDLALALRAYSVRIVAPLPGKNVVGIEVPNREREVVVLRDLVTHSSYLDPESPLTIALGKDIFGTPVSADLGQMPHLLVAGATGSGKSVFLNVLLLSILFKATPDQVKLLLIDPKMLEFSVFHDLPHLIAEVVTNPKRAAAALMGIVRKMEERYQLMSEKGVRNIAQYNKLVMRERAKKNRPLEDDELPPPEALPYIVVVVDELADLMIVASRDVEESLMRLAQMARAAGIHLVLATQRPSVDVLTGIIKANFPTRIAFQVSSRTDSRTVLDGNGAERLLGQGDSLMLPPGTSRLERIHAPYVSEKEVAAVCNFLREQGPPELDETLIRLKEESERREERGEEFDELFDEAVDVVAKHRIASISFIQRKLRIGYNRSARIVEQLEAEGIIGPQEGTSPREIYVRPPDEEA